MAKKRGAKGEYGQGSIYSNPDGSYTVAVRLKKGEKPTRRRCPDEHTAELVKAALLKLRDKGIAADPVSLDAALSTLERLRDDYIDVEASLQRFDTFIDRWFSGVVCVRDGITERTLDDYRGTIRRYLRPYFGAMTLIQIKPPHVSAFLNQLRSNLAPSTVKKAYSTLRQALDTAVAWRFIPFNPCAAVEKPKVKKTEKPALSATHVRSLLHIVEGHPTATAFHVMATLGTRLGETLALRRIDFNTDFTEVTIATQISYHSRKRVVPKDDSKRPLPVPPKLSRRLAAQWAVVQGFHGLMFPSEADTPFQPSNVEKLWNGYTQRRPTKKGRKEYIHKGFREKAELPEWATIHSLRTFVATTLEEVETEQRTTGHILGHGAKNVTEKYIRRRLPAMRRALEKLEGVLWGAVEQEEETGT